MVEIYHMLNRGVDKRNIFLDDEDRVRFVHDMFEFNDVQPAGNTHYSFTKQKKNGDSKYLDFVSPNILKERIVDIHGWCLMDNHYHLLLSECVDGGLTQFIRKLNIGYVKYFNEKYDRVGTLFQGRTKKVLIASDGHFLHILNYIHLNPLDMLPGARKWREYEVKSVRDAMRHLDSYRWSSYLDYCGKKNFPSILTTGTFADASPRYRAEVASYLKNMGSESLQYSALE
jgi:putative transposase